VDWCSCSDSEDDIEGKSEEKRLDFEVERSRSKSKSREACDGAGEMGNTVVGGTRTGNVVVTVGFFWDVDADVVVVEEVAGIVESVWEGGTGEGFSDTGVGGGRPVGSP
jgi:hypothetical protein